MLAAGSRLTEFILDLQGLGQDGDGNDDDDTSAANSANIFWDITA
jgi:hypothetical protein